MRAPVQVPGPGHYKQYFTYDTTLAATHNRAPTVPIGLKPEPKIVYTKGVVTELPAGLYGMRKTYSTRAQMGKLGLGSDEIRFKVLPPLIVSRSATSVRDSLFNCIALGHIRPGPIADLNILF